MPKIIDVLVVDDSPAAALHLVQTLTSDRDIRVIGTARGGREALQILERTKPDVIVMDVYMPDLDGYQTAQLVMERKPTPIVICSGRIYGEEAIATFKSMEAGALAVVAKPVAETHSDYTKQSQELIVTVKLMSEVAVVRRWAHNRVVKPPSALQTGPGNVEIVAIGASTGGPMVIQTILRGLPKDLKVPVLIVQHIAPGFCEGMAAWLRQTTGYRVQVAKAGTAIQPGHAYMAPDDAHMAVRKGGVLTLSKAKAENGLRPSVAHLFRSVASGYGNKAVAILLTGMGNDGADELKHLKGLGSITIAQDEASSVVHGMPGEAISIGGATYVLGANSIASTVADLVAHRT